MFHRKLSALQYPDAAKFDHTDAGQVRSVALWLEEQKIRHYPAEARAKLRQLDSQQWPEAYQQYLRDLAAPVPADDPDGCLDWLLGRAVRLSYGDNLKKYQSAQSGALSQQSNKTNAPPQNPLDNLDFNSADFVSGVERLAKILDVPCHPDHLITLEAVCILVTERLSSKVLADPSQVVVQGTAFPLDEADLGFDTGDAVLNRAAKVLRLLYIQDMRQLQTAINEILVAVQNLIADPRTDTRLGKVGR